MCREVPELGPEEQQEAALRYIQERYGQAIKFDMLPPAEYIRRIKAGESPEEVQADIMDRIVKSFSPA